MLEIDNCPVCNTACKLEYGIGEVGKNEHRIEIAYATCKTCKTKWRRKNDPQNLGKLIYEKWSCRIPATSIPFPFVGGGIKVSPKWCRWQFVTERRISVGTSNAKEAKETAVPVKKDYDETISLEKRNPARYEFDLVKNDEVKGEISSDSPMTVWFMDEENMDRYDNRRRHDVEDGTEDVYQARISFKARKKGLWYIVIENKEKTPTKVKVHIYST
jgi:hypothetical protein